MSDAIDLDQFVATRKGDYHDFDGAYGYQCMDLVELYNRDVIQAPRLGGDAKDLVSNPQSDFYEFKYNSIMYIPPPGSIAVWNEKVGNGFGHTAVVISAKLMTFVSLDQNWPEGAQTQLVEHRYTNVVGFLVPRIKGLVTKYQELVSDLQALVTKHKLK